MSKTLKKALLGAGIALCTLSMAAIPADATHSDPDVDHGYVSCSGTETAYATGYGYGFMQVETIGGFSSTSHSYWRYDTSPPGIWLGSSSWAASADDLNPAYSYGHCG